jgi:hypothetical protein
LNKNEDTECLILITFSFSIMHNNFRFFSLIAALITVGLNGCSSSSTSPSSTSTPTGSGPTTGSTYTYQIRQYNVDGSVASTDTATVTMTGIQSSWNGMSNVYQFNNGHSYVYESDGDLNSYLSETQSYNGNSEWMLLPFSGSGAQRVVFYSSDSVTDVLHAGFVVNSTMTVNGTPLTTNEVETIDSTTKKTSFGGSSLYTQYDDYWFAPSIGAMAQVDIGIFTDAKTGDQTGKKVETLISYSVK